MYNRTIFDGFQFKKDLNHQVEGVPNGRVGVSEPDHQSVITSKVLRVCFGNVAIMRGQSNVVVEVITRHEVDICGLQEVSSRRCIC